MLSALETAACPVVASSGDGWESQSWVLVLEESRRVSGTYKVVLIYSVDVYRCLPGDEVNTRFLRC